MTNELPLKCKYCKREVKTLYQFINKKNELDKACWKCIKKEVK